MNLSRHVWLVDRQPRKERDVPRGGVVRWTGVPLPLEGYSLPLEDKVKKKKYLVTGGAGFIGSHVVDALLAEKDTEVVTVIDDLSTGWMTNLDSRAVFVQRDICTVGPIELVSYLEDVHAVFHLAALANVTESWDRPEDYYDVNTVATFRLGMAAQQAGVKHFVFSSSSSVYGRFFRDAAQIEGPAVESTEVSPLSPYAASKLAAEQALEVVASAGGDMKIAVLRYFNVYGPRQRVGGPYSAVIPVFMKAALEGRPMVVNKGAGIRSFVYVEDVARENLMAATSDTPFWTMNVSSEEDSDEVIPKLAQKVWVAMGRGGKVTIERGAARKGDVKDAVGASEVNDEPYYPQRTSLKDGLALTAAWWRGQDAR